jgi:16S rRNA (guanine(966)-N(2))-methyltransferase RsmD
MKKELITTVLAGKLKGKKLLLPSLETTRSSKQILKGSVFDRLQFDIIDSTFVEVFAGSGSVGIEAISRGAKMAYFIEKDDKAYSTLKENLKACSITNYEAIHGDSFEHFSTILTRINEPAYFYFDPPFALRDGYDEVYDKVINMIASIESEKIIEVIIEYQTGIDLPEQIGSLTLAKKRKFGKSSLNFYTL